MPANTSPVFSLTPQCAMVLTSAANTDRVGGGTIYTVLTGATNGSRVERVTATATVTTAAGVLRFYIVDGSGTIRLVKEFATSAVTPSGTVIAAAQEWVRTDGLPLCVLPATYVLKVGLSNAEAWAVVAYAGDF